MNRKRRNINMLVPTVIMGFLVLVLVSIGYYKGQYINDSLLSRQGVDFKIFH